MGKNIQFLLDGCDICFVAEAPEDIKLKDFIALCDLIEPDWCACGIRSLSEKESENCKPEIIFTKNTVKTADDSVTCTIHKNRKWIEDRY